MENDKEIILSELRVKRGDYIHDSDVYYYDDSWKYYEDLVQLFGKDNIIDDDIDSPDFWHRKDGDFEGYEKYKQTVKNLFEKDSKMSINDYLKGEIDPHQAFSVLRNHPTNTTTEKITLLKSLVKTWEFFAKEKGLGRLHYRPNDHEDTKGLTGHIEMGNNPDSTFSVQFNARSLQNTFVVTFDKTEISKHQIQNYLFVSLRHNTSQYIKENQSNQQAVGMRI